MQVKIKAKKIHEILEAFTFIFIAITCSILVLRTSINQENLSKASTCVGGGIGILKLILNSEQSDFSQFVHGNEEFNRRVYEHILRPRDPDSFVFSPTLFAIPLMFLSLASKNGPNQSIVKEILDAASLPCNLNYLKQDLQTLINQVRTISKIKNTKSKWQLPCW